MGDKSSDFYPDEHSTRVGDGNSYIYEELLQTEGTDVKVRTVRPEHMHMLMHMHMHMHMHVHVHVHVHVHMHTC